MKGDSLGDRLKSNYEDRAKTFLPRRMPLILRLDGKAFHTYTRRMTKPYDAKLHELMCETTKYLMEEIQAAQIGYTQSDEISIFVHDYKRLNSDAWFDKNVQKIVSVAASIAASFFSLNSHKLFEDLDIGEPLVNDCKIAHFDCRAFVLPEAELCNYFIWRQQDATRNSIQMLAQSLYSQKELNNKNTSELQELTFQKGKNWNDVETKFKRGSCVYKIPDPENIGRTKMHIDYEIPIFTQDRDFINKYLAVEQED
jgi:tRNA(His) 5'-end guanylyltransferase